jgi:hypothetical protein
MRLRRIIAATIGFSSASIAVACGRTELDDVLQSSGAPCAQDSDCPSSERCDVAQNICVDDACTAVCGAAPHVVRITCDGECKIAACDADGFADCNGEYADGCEVDTRNESSHCGTCANACSVAQGCARGECSLLEGAFEPSENPTYLSPGPHHFTRIHVPKGITVHVSGPGERSGQLELHSEGPIVIDGMINVSGGPGLAGFTYTDASQTGVAGAGGNTGEPYGTGELSAACTFVAGNPGQRGMNVLGSAGSCPVISSSQCEMVVDRQWLFTAPLAQAGGGAGVHTACRAYGSGGGGPAGGGPGALCPPRFGGPDCSGVAAGGGATAGDGGYAGSEYYNGYRGREGVTPCNACVGGGGGGSIGTSAAADLAVLSTFQTGSGGGGGSADYQNRPSRSGTSGGGGGGGALRLTTPSSITINGQLLADGGPGGDAFIGTGLESNCNPEPGAAGGGGSGGLVYLVAPAITVSSGAIISAVGGAGGKPSPHATGGGGGGGGLGRIRFSVDASACTLLGLFNPPVVNGCAITTQPGAAYIGAYPN